MKPSNDVSGVQVVHRSEVPLTDGEHAFAAHAVLARFVPTGGASLRSIVLVEGDARTIAAGELRTLVLVLAGTASLEGKTVRAGDTVPLQPGERAHVTAVPREGVELLAIGIPSGPPPTAAGLVALAAARAASARRGPFSMLLENGVLDDPIRRERFLACLQVISDAFQTILLTRQATVRDPRFEAPFRTHFLQELGHNALLARREGSTKIDDPVLTATTTWFCRRMLVLDNLDKAVLVHLVLETAGADFHTRAREVLSGSVADEYFSAHAEADPEHMIVPDGLLEGHDVETYRRLYDLVETGWDVFDAMGRRIAHIVELGR